MSGKVLHLLRGLEIGGLERAVLRLATRGIQEGWDHSLLLFDKPFRSRETDFSPAEVPTDFIQRGPGVDYRFAQRVAEHLIRKQVGIVHAHNDSAIFYAALAILIAKRPISLIGRFGARPTHRTTGARVLTRWASGRAAQIAAVSEELRRWLMRSKWVKKCITIWNGVDLTEFCPEGSKGDWRRALEIPDNAIFVGHVGRLDPVKRHSDIIKSATMLRHSQRPIYFAFAGNGPLIESVRSEVATLNNVRLLSNVENIPSFLRSLDIFVLCSDHEGCPLALLEAMACGRPVIATSVGGMPYLLDATGHAPAGLLIPPRCPDLLAEQIATLASSGELRHRLSLLARRRANTFSFEREWAEYSQLYSKALSG
jgi:L-malate glycosyltransferase